MMNDPAAGPSNDNLLSDKDRAALKESVMDFAGHFSTASAILAGFYMATCAFIISIRADESAIFSFLDDPLLAEMTFLADLSIEILTVLDMRYLWPSHFEYMLLILTSLFLLSLISYSCFLYVGFLQMDTLKMSRRIPEEKLLTWQQRGTKTLIISLVFSFISLPWALLRFIYVNSFLMTFILLFIVIIILVITFKGWTVLKKIFTRIRGS